MKYGRHVKVRSGMEIAEKSMIAFIPVVALKKMNFSASKKGSGAQRSLE